MTSLIMSKRRLRSMLLGTVVARAWYVSPRYSTVTSGSATRFLYHCGWVFMPPMDPATTSRPLSSRTQIGVAWRLPDLAPMVVMITSGGASSVGWPALARSSAITVLLRSRMSTRTGGSGVLMADTLSAAVAKALVTQHDGLYRLPTWRSEPW